MKLLLKISYLGTDFKGFQVQPGCRTVQGVMCECTSRLFGVDCAVTGCSRTDSGVHANVFYCTVEYGEGANNIPAGSVCAALNHYLPDDISVSEAKEVDDTFHVRYDVVSKEYLYLINNGRNKDPFLHGRAFHYPRALDADIMNKAAQALTGEHDFSSFCSAGSSVEDKIRTIHSICVERNGDTVSIRVRGNGFLYNMVRIIVGTLCEVSDGKINADEIENIIQSRDRSKAGFTAPGCGLYLNDVKYD